ncbi:MAG: 50S ribosomal protein L32 [Candidatus Binataceae bacterium]
MQAPKRRTSSSKRDKRRAHDHLKPVTPVSCSNCGEPVLSHHVCRHCGVYRGREMAPAQE